MDYSTEPNTYRYVPELPLYLRKALLPAIDYVLKAFPDSPLAQRAMMSDLDKDIFYPHGGLCNYRSAQVEEEIQLNFGSVPASVNVSVSTTHDILKEVDLAPGRFYQVSLHLTFSTKINGQEDSLKFNKFMFSKSTQRFFDDLGNCSGLREGQHNVMAAGEYSARSGANFGDVAFRISLQLNNLNLPNLRHGIRKMMQELAGQIDLGLEQLNALKLS